MASMLRKTIVFSACAAVLGGCATPPDASYESRLAEMMEPFDDLRRQKADLWRLGHEPQEFEFDGAGKVIVRRWELVGWPGEVYVQARFTYENTTDHPVAEAFVWLDVLDSENRVAGSTAVRLLNPMGYPFWPGHTYTTEVRAATNGAHLDEGGWSWSVACESREETEPGVEPFIIDPEDPPRGWWLLEGSSAKPPHRPTTVYYAPPYAPRHVPGVR